MADIGNYRSRVKIYKRVYTSNGMGGFSQTLSEVDTVWAEVMPMSGREATRFRQAYPTATFRIRMRYRRDVNTDYKIYYNSKYHNILYVEDTDNKQDELIILTEVTESEG